jgi:hypothetical protein
MEQIVEPEVPSDVPEMVMGKTSFQVVGLIGAASKAFWT